jgi:hypothetical protein
MDHNIANYISTNLSNTKCGTKKWRKSSAQKYKKAGENKGNGIVPLKASIAAQVEMDDCTSIYKIMDHNNLSKSKSGT